MDQIFMTILGKTESCSQPGAKWPPWGPRNIAGRPRVQNRIWGAMEDFRGATTHQVNF